MADKLSINEKCTAFTERTSLHGLQNVGGSTGKTCRRATWLLLMLLMLALLILYFVAGLTHYLSYPTTTKINQFENSSLVFPAVTICNNNLVTSTYMEENPLVSNVTGAYANTFKFEPTMNLSDPTIIAEMNNITYLDMFTKGGHHLEKMFLFCIWNGDSSSSCSDYFVPVLTDFYGLCYTFNTDGAYQSVSPGIFYGMELFVDVQQYVYSHYGSSPGAGLKVLIHEPHSFPVLQTKALSIPPGVVTELMVSRKENIYLPEPYEGPGCHNGDEYTILIDCKMTCSVNYLVSKCGCLAMPYLPKDYPNCSLYEYTQCILPEIFEYWVNKTIEEACGCLHYCHEISYDVKLSQMLYPSNYAASYYNTYKQINLTTKQYREGITYLKIYYESLTTSVTEQVASYSFAQFSAEIGGYMGLFLGASLLTLTELLEFLVVLISSFCWKKGKVTTEMHIVYDK